MTKFSIASLMVNTNMKAKITNARERGHKFSGQSTDEANNDTREFLGVIMMDGLNQSSQMMWKF